MVVTLGNLVPFSVFVLLIVVRARGDAILQSYEFFGLIGFGSELAAVHNRVHKFVGRFETERKQCEVVKRVLFVNDNQHFVIRRRPFGVAEQLVLRLDEVFVFNHLVPHGQQRAELFDFVEEAAERRRNCVRYAFDERVDFHILLIVTDVVAEHVERGAVVVFDIADVFVEVLFDVGFECFEVVCVIECRRQICKQVPYDFVDDDFLVVGPIRSFGILLHKNVDYGLQIRVRAFNLNGVLRQSVLFHRLYINSRTAGQGKNENDADDTNTARKRRKRSSAFFAQKVCETERYCGAVRHRAFAARLAVGTDALSDFASFASLFVHICKKRGDFVFWCGFDFRHGFGIFLITCAVKIRNVLGVFRLSVCNFLFFFVVKHGFAVAVRRTLFPAVRCAVTRNDAVFQVDYTGAVLVRQRFVVRDHYDEFLFGNFFEQLHNLHARLAVKRARRLVG